MFYYSYILWDFANAKQFAVTGTPAICLINQIESSRKNRKLRWSFGQKPKLWAAY